MVPAILSSGLDNDTSCLGRSSLPTLRKGHGLHGREKVKLGDVGVGTRCLAGCFPRQVLVNTDPLEPAWA